ncbi:MAG: tRNA (N(6)-L-threonylcarbamoyladenosine(37)-C(2))-methylthiotransferase MtaB [Christensenellaceae bacterium]|jgi:threonylcarbamoyladenosine tRNA methylthiotransferase MtaB|nr:tRNA (N(6)-L-threonylcarbamoyladenosine(37)-C(2))-methylthiotransferase MtaB [Christensenellaceae bacterium]
MKICVLNLGCKVNQYEIDAISAALDGEHEVVGELTSADIYILNTCAVTAEAEKKSRQHIAKINKMNPNAKIVVCGCASEHNPEQFIDKPNVATVIGTAGKGGIKEIIRHISFQTNCHLGESSLSVIPERAQRLDAVTCWVTESPQSVLKEIPCIYEDDLFSKQTRTRGYLKVQDGCDSFCSYCLIPYIRGRSRSRPLESIKKEAEFLSKSCLEIVITGINLSDYKVDQKPALAELMMSLGGLNCRLRLSSLENGIITDKFLSVLQALKNFCPHFHLSLQSGSNNVLKGMNRKYTREQFLDKVRLIYKYFPDAAVTTDIIVGYPTETEEDFNQSLDLVREAGFSAVHFFAYSNREGTAAAGLPQINGTIIKQRENVLREVVREFEQKYNAGFIGKPLGVLIEEKVGGYFVGYSQNYIRCFIKVDDAIMSLQEAQQRSNPMDILNTIVKAAGVELFKDGLLCKV